MSRWFVMLTSLAVGGLVGAVGAGSYLHGQPGKAPPPVNATPPAVAKELPSYRDIVKKVLPAVVSIEMQSHPAAHVKPNAKPNAKQKQPFQLPDDMQIPEELRKQFENAIPFNFDEEMPEQPVHGFGSGFLIDPKGVILTNNHVVNGADQVEVTLADGRRFTSKDIKKDPKTDLAVVRIHANDPLPYLELGNSDGMEIGDRVLAVGAPFGLVGSVTSGIISGKGRTLDSSKYEDFIQTDAAINPGNSGGPLISLEGKVIGINTAIKTRTGGFQGIGLAIPSNMAKFVADQLVKTGTVRRAYLGVQIKNLTDRDLAAHLGVKGQGGVLVASVMPNTPAAKAGLQAGDVIVALNGKPVRDMQEFQNEIASSPIDKDVSLGVVREGKEQTLHVRVELMPQDYAVAKAPAQKPAEEKLHTVKVDKAGMELADLTPRLADELGYAKGTKGVFVAKVNADGPAAAAGLARGMLITRVDRQPVTSAQRASEKLEHTAMDKGVLLQVESPSGGMGYVLLKAAAETEAK